MTFKAIIYDMDGTLVASEHVWAQAEGEMLTARGGAYTKEIRDKVLGLRLDVFFAKLRPFFNLSESTPDLIAELVERMLVLIPSTVTPMPGAPELVSWVQSEGIPCAIASASPQAIIEAIVESQGWSAAIPLRVSADDVPHGKPAPDVYLKTAELLGVAPQDCLALEDTPNGARSAVAAGMTTYVIVDPTHTHAALFEGITPYVYNSLYEVMDSIRGKR